MDNNKKPVDLEKIKLPLSLEDYYLINRMWHAGQIEMSDLSDKLRRAFRDKGEEIMEKKWPNHFDVNY